MLRLAEAQQSRDWQAVWLNIFASQLEALGAMAGVEGSVDLSPHYQSHVERRETILGADQQRSPAATLKFGPLSWGGCGWQRCMIAKAQSQTRVEGFSTLPQNPICPASKFSDESRLPLP